MRKRAGSIIAGDILRDYRQEKFYKNKKRQNCKEKECEKCPFEKVCKE